MPTDALAFIDLRRETRDILWFAVLFVGAAVATGLAIRAWPHPVWGATEFLQDAWYVFVFKIGLLLLVPFALYRRWGYAWRDGLLGWRPTPRALLVVAVSFAAGVVVNAGRWNEIEAGWKAFAMSEAAARSGLGVLFAFVNAGIPEEFVYRGLLQTRLEASWGRVPAILVSNVLFVAWHIPTRYLHAHGVEGQAGDLLSVLVGTGIPVGIVGILFALAWDRWRNLPALMAIHAGVDTIPITSSMLQVVAAQFR